MISNIFVLNKYYKTKKILSVNGKNAFFDDLYTQDLSTGTESYEFYTNTQGIEETDFIMFLYHGQYKLFQVSEIEIEHSQGNIITYCYGESACLELLNGAVRPFEGEFNALSFFNHILQGTEWSIGVYNTPLADKVISVKVDKTTQIWTLIQDYMEEFGYEVNTRVIYENGNLKYKLIDIYMEGELGNKTYKRFEFGRNVEGIVKKKDLYDWCTALIIDSEEDIVELEYDNEGFVKEKGSDVLLATKENNIYNNGRPYIYGSFEDNKSPSGQEVIEKAVAELKNRCVPKFDYECDTILTYEEYENVNIGDTVYVIDTTFEPPVLLEARVGKLEISFTDRNSCKCNLTNYKEIKSRIDVTLTGTIQAILDTYFPIGSSQLGMGAIEKKHLSYAYINELEADIAVISTVVSQEVITNEIYAEEGQINNFVAERITATKAELESLISDEIIAIDGKFTNLITDEITAIDGRFSTIESDVGIFNNVISNHFVGDSMQSLHITSANTVIDNAVIKDAMIDTISADKINSGTINTNNVSIQSETGAISISNNTMQFKEGDTVRIQIGEDANGNFNFVLYGKDGEGVLINDEGITESGIADGLIRDNHVSENANISGSKLNINSVIKSINEDGTETLDSSKIYLNDEEQTLQIAFNQLKTKVDTIEDITVDGDLSSVIEQVTINTTAINIQQGQIDNLVSNTTITKEDGQTVQLKDEYTSISQTVDSLNTSVAECITKGEIEEINKALNENIDTTVQESINNIEKSFDELYTNKEEFDSYVSVTDSKFTQTNESMEMKFSQSITVANQVNNSLEAFKAEQNSFIRYSADGIEIGELGSPFNTRLDNEKLSFTQDNSEVAYISNNKMYITSAEVTNDMKMGRFVWVVGAEGDLTLKWS